MSGNGPHSGCPGGWWLQARDMIQSFLAWKHFQYSVDNYHTHDQWCYGEVGSFYDFLQKLSIIFQTLKRRAKQNRVFTLSIVYKRFSLPTSLVNIVLRFSWWMPSSGMWVSRSVPIFCPHICPPILFWLCLAERLPSNCTRKCQARRDLHILPGRAPSTLSLLCFANHQLILSPLLGTGTGTFFYWQSSQLKSYYMRICTVLPWPFTIVYHVYIFIPTPVLVIIDLKPRKWKTSYGNHPASDWCKKQEQTSNKVNKKQICFPSVLASAYTIETVSGELILT